MQRRIAFRAVSGDAVDVQLEGGGAGDRSHVARRSAIVGKLPFMPFYGGDFYQDESVALMSYEEQGIYQRLLWHQWREGSVPGGVAELASLLHTEVPERVLACFPLKRDRRQNPKLEAVRAHHDAISESKRHAAKSRWDKGKDAEPMQKPCTCDAKPMPSEERRENQRTTSVAKATGDEPPLEKPFHAVMGAARKHLYRGQRPDHRDGSAAKTLLARHPVETVLLAVEGLRILVDRGGLPPKGRGSPVHLLDLESPKWGINVFSASLDAYYTRDPPDSGKRERTGPTSLGTLLREAG